MSARWGMMAVFGQLIFEWTADDRLILWYNGRAAGDAAVGRQSRGSAHKRVANRWPRRVKGAANV